MLPDQISEFRAQSSAVPYRAGLEATMPENFGLLSAAVRDYRLKNGDQFTVTIIKTRSDSAAYALLTYFAALSRQGEHHIPAELIETGDVGTASFISPEGVAFFKGSTYVGISGSGKLQGSEIAMLALARSIDQTIDKGEGDIPVLVKHLPDWQTAQERAVYAVSLPALQKATGHQPVLDAITFDGGTEAVTASYGPSRLVIVEFNTPQLAGEADAHINTRIKELRESGQPVPSAYHRVGNYSVFVFDAPDEKAAEQLIGSISYEQVVQWLGPNPHALERAQRQYTEKTANILMTVLKASGLSLLLCIGAGAAFGGIIFMRRRAQQATATAYTDAGGMLRLNLDDLTAPSERVRLLSRGDG